MEKKTIEENKERFISLISSIDRKDFDVKGLIDWLTTRSDFFTAPASTKYHGSYEGGLCAHSLNVYDHLVSLISQFGFIDKYSSDSLKIVALLHDISKANYYETSFKNKKVYVKAEERDEYTKKDEKGYYNWVQVPEYVVKNCKDRFLYGNHEETSEFMVRSFGQLSVEESVSILYHHAGMGFDSSKADIGQIFTKYPLALFMHQADMIASFVTENAD